MEKILGLWSLIDVAVVLGIALVLPTCLGHRRAWWAAALATACACLFPAGSPGAFVLGGVWLVVAVRVGFLTVASSGPLIWWNLRHVATGVASSYAVVAALWFELSRMGASPLGITEPIVQLTAVHFTYVGVAALMLGLAGHEGARSRSGRRVGLVAVALTAGAPVLVALGFVTHNPWAQIGGAVLVSLGVFCTAALELAAAHRPGPIAPRLLLCVSGLSIWFPMVLAVFWAAGQHVGVWALGTDTMVRTHGAINALGFVAAGLMAVALERRQAEVRFESEVGAWS